MAFYAIRLIQTVKKIHCIPSHIHILLLVYQRREIINRHVCCKSIRLNKAGTIMNDTNLIAVLLMAIILTLLFSSCLLLEEAFLTPYESADQNTSTYQTKGQSTPDLQVTWLLTARDLNAVTGDIITLQIPAQGSASSVWGTGIYTDDSSIGTAAVHAGLISFASGGKVTIKIVEGMSSYEGSQSNGVATSGYGAWGGSFVFIDSAGRQVTVGAKPTIQEVVAPPQATQTPPHPDQKSL